MTYYTVSENGLIDSVWNDYIQLSLKFPKTKIYESKKPITSIYINEI